MSQAGNRETTQRHRIIQQLGSQIAYRPRMLSNWEKKKKKKSYHEQSVTHISALSPIWGRLVGSWLSWVLKFGQFLNEEREYKTRILRRVCVVFLRSNLVKKKTTELIFFFFFLRELWVCRAWLTGWLLMSTHQFTSFIFVVFGIMVLVPFFFKFSCTNESEKNNNLSLRTILSQVNDQWFSSHLDWL